MREINGKVDEGHLERVLSIRREMPVLGVPAPRTGRKISPHATSFLFKDGTITTVFAIKPIYYQHLSGQWRPLSEIASYYGNRGGMILKDGWENKVHMNYLIWYMKRQEEMKGMGVLLPYIHQPLLVNDTLVVTPDAGNPGTSSFDANVLYNDFTPYATGHDATDAQSADMTTTEGLVQNQKRASGNFDIHRCLTFFDTSALTASASISAATITMIKVEGSTNNSQTVTAYYSTLSSNTVATTSDGSYSSIGTTAQSDDNHSLGASNGLLTWNLNATGLGNIQKTATSKFAFRASGDVANAGPASDGTNLQGWNSADVVGTSNDPTLTVTYTLVAASSTPSSTLLLMGVG